jgi:hypothetical protein
VDELLMASSVFRSMLSIDAKDSVVRLPDVASPTLLKIVGVLRTGEWQVEPSNTLNVATLRVCEKYDLLSVGRAFLEKSVPRLYAHELQEALCWALTFDGILAGNLILLNGHASSYPGCRSLNPSVFPKTLVERFRPSWMHALFNAAHDIPRDGELYAALKITTARPHFAAGFVKYMSEYIRPPGVETTANTN